TPNNENIYSRSLSGVVGEAAPKGLGTAIFRANPHRITPIFQQATCVGAKVFAQLNQGSQSGFNITLEKSGDRIWSEKASPQATEGSISSFFCQNTPTD
ncbi:hypothetical protein C8B47_27360, partial [filamentous cyanobacterium CCP4]